ncbi:MAG TPA: hypothetical protein VIN03_10215 [Roseateles sp.]
MPNFVINKNPQANGDHEVHNASTGCAYMPAPANQIELGLHASCHGAVLAAKSQWPNNRINGCYYCTNACHTS